MDFPQFFSNIKAGFSLFMSKIEKKIYDKYQTMEKNKIVFKNDDEEEIVNKYFSVENTLRI